MRSTIHESEFYLMELVEAGIIKVTRKNVPFTCPEDVERACEPVQRWLDVKGRAKHTVLIDSRPVVGRNDPTSEAMFKEHRDAMVKGFAGVALLVQTPVGRLQIQRLLNEGGIDAKVFMDELEALAYLRTRERRSMPPPPKRR